ncbi:MAG: TerC family protein [Bacteroidia bacterium]|jgi:predicted tellurium resistance membrane protein TerC|nr:TerC family protein [Bacteroidia bacterium]
MDLPDFSSSGVWISLLTLTFLEIVLGVDNIIFISIVTDKLPQHQQRRARNLGLTLALVMRVMLLFAITWMLQLKEPVLKLSFMEEPNSPGTPLGISWKDIILIVGGLFLLAKSTLEIHRKLEKSKAHGAQSKYATFTAVLVQVVLVDMVFSVDSILTAIGLVENVLIMIIAVVASMGVMLAFAGAITRFINRHPAMQILALAFLVAIGLVLIANGFHQNFNKGYIYSGMAFALVVEMINIRMRKNRESVELNTQGVNVEEEVNEMMGKK